MEKVYITKTLIKNDNQSELDFVLQDEFGFDYENNSDLVQIEKTSNYYADAEPIRIDEMIEILNNLKKSGSTHVQIESHGDHHGYDISGFEIRLSTEEEINEYELDLKIKKDKKDKISELQKQIEKIKNS